MALGYQNVRGLNTLTCIIIILVKIIIIINVDNNL